MKIVYVLKNNLRDLDHQQHIILQQVTVEKDKLERERQKLKLLFKKKKLHADDIEQKLTKLSDALTTTTTSITDANHHRVNDNNHTLKTNGREDDQEDLRNTKGSSTLGNNNKKSSHYQTLFNGNEDYGTNNKNDIPPSWHTKSLMNGSTNNDSLFNKTHPNDIYNTLSMVNYRNSPSEMRNDEYINKLNELKEMISVAKLEKMTILEQQLRERYTELVQFQEEHTKRLELEKKLADEMKNRDYLVECQVKLREKNRVQERPLTRYLAIRSSDFDLRQHKGCFISFDPSM
ncbi:unnamed protein product [Didymodactylos carnosus]|uniref:Uncharacterized protein n=1 Tax=Didymodactylos carnosus TaxID=1234261 RepID=A0A8S2QUB0_9BILA|nr:unnamed protein product [Didymodactylos carnosus]CAF4119279.1 unnamed protein product [Didymodactylos carnosus]